MVQLSKDSVCTSRLAVAIRAIHASIIAAEAAGKALPFKTFGDYATLGGLVCVAKEAARQWRERADNAD